MTGSSEIVACLAYFKNKNPAQYRTWQSLMRKDSNVFSCGEQHLAKHL